MEYPTSKNVSLLSEFIFQWFATDLIINGVKQDNSVGNRMESMVGVRARFGNIKTKLGIGFSLGEEKSREYDYRIIIGISYITDVLTSLLN